MFGGTLPSEVGTLLSIGVWIPSPVGRIILVLALNCDKRAQKLEGNPMAQLNTVTCSAAHTQSSCKAG